MSEQEIIRTLNELLSVAEGGTRGYYEAAQQVSDSRLKSALLDCSFESARSLTELQNSIDTLSPAASPGSPPAAAVRDWFGADVRRAGTEQALREAIVRDQTRAAEVCTQALHQPLPKPVRRVVSRQRRGLLLNRQRIRELARRRGMPDDRRIRFRLG